MGVPLAARSGRGQHPVDPAHVLAQTLYGNGDVFHELDRFQVAGRQHQQAEPCLAHRPDVLLRAAVSYDQAALRQHACGAACFGLRAPGEFDQQERLGAWRGEAELAGVPRHSGGAVENAARHQLDSSRLEGQDVGRRLAGLRDRRRRPV